MSANGATNLKKDNIKYIIHSLISLFFMFGFGLLAPFNGLEPLGMKILGIFLGMLWGWTFIGFIWPSIFGLIALGLSDYGTVDSLMKAGWSNTSITIFCLLLLVMAKHLENIGLSRKIAFWFISRKVNVGRPYVFTTMIFLAGFALGATVSLFASIFLLWGIFYEICDILGFEKKSKYVVIVLVGIVYSSMLGYAVFPFKALALMVLNQLNLASGGLTIDFLDYTILSFFICIGCLCVYVLVIKFILRPNVAPLLGDNDYFAEHRGEKLDKQQCIGAIFLIIFIFAMFAPSVGFLKATWIGSLFAQMGATGSLFFLLAVLAFVRVDGKSALDFQACAAGINWDVIIMFVATMPVASALESEQAGVMNWITELLTPVFQGMGPMTFTIVFCLLAGILTQFCHNVVLAVVMTPIAYNFAVLTGANPFIVIVIMAFSLGIAVATPGGSAMGALIYLNTEWIGTANAYKYCAVVAVISLIFMLIIGVPLGLLIFA